MHWGKDVLGKSIQTEEGRVKIVGVIKDFNIGGFYSELKPFVVHHHPIDLSLIHILNEFHAQPPQMYGDTN